MSRILLRKTLVPIAAAGVVATGMGASAVSAMEAPAPAQSAEDQAAAEPIVDVTDENLQELIDNSAQQQTIFLVTAPSWCGPCQMLDPMIRQKAEADGGKWTLAVVDEANVSQQTIGYFGISGYPTMVPYVGGQEQGERAVGVPGGSQAGVDAYVDSVMTGDGGGDPGDGDDGDGGGDDGKLPELPEGAVQITDENYEKEVIEESKTRPVILDFSKDMCLPCIDLAPVLDEKYIADEGAWQYTRIDGTQYPELWEKYGKPWFPTLIAIKDGEEVARRSGYDGDAAKVNEWLQTIADGEIPETDPKVTDINDEESWNKALEISKRVPVAVRLYDNADEGTEEQGQMAAAMADGDGGKWTLANVDLANSPMADTITEFVGTEGDIERPTMVIVYDGKARFDEGVQGAIGGADAKDETKLRAWVDQMLAFQYPTESTESFVEIGQTYTF